MLDPGRDMHLALLARKVVLHGTLALPSSLGANHVSRGTRCRASLSAGSGCCRG